MTTPNDIPTPESASEVASPNKASAPIETEIAKILLANSLEFVRGTTQILHGLTSLLLTSYVALVIGFHRDTGFPDLRSFLLTCAPIILFAASLALGFFRAISYRGAELVFDSDGQPRGTMRSYETISQQRRRHVVWPSILASLGLLAIVLSFLLVTYPVILKPQP